MNRRDFVFKSSMAGVALASTGPLLGNILNTNETISVGVIGTGDRGGGIISLINQIPNMKVIACCDILAFRLEKGLQRAGIKRGYEDYRKMLDDKDIDAVVVATPFSTHSEIEQDAIAAGKHVYGEKTLAKGYEGIQNLLKAKNPDLIFQTGHQYHSSRLYTHVVDMINDGKIGKITAFECQWNRNGDWRRPVPNPKYEKLINWRMYKEYSGGLTAELCSHQIDFVNWVTGNVPKQVFGTGGINYWKDGRETYDNIHHIYDYPEGIRAKFTCLTSNAMGDYEIKVMGDKGTLILDYDKAWFFPEGKENKVVGEVDGVSGATVTWDKGKGIPIKIEHQDSTKQALTDFRDAIKSNTEPRSNMKTGAKAAVSVQMALDSMYNNKIVEWNQSFDKWLKA